jgi:hypothetical protein
MKMTWGMLDHAVFRNRQHAVILNRQHAVILNKQHAVIPDLIRDPCPTSVHLHTDRRWAPGQALGDTNPPDCGFATSACEHITLIVSPQGIPWQQCAVKKSIRLCMALKSAR